MEERPVTIPMVKCYGCQQELKSEVIDNLRPTDHKDRCTFEEDTGEECYECLYQVRFICQICNYVIDIAMSDLEQLKRLEGDKQRTRFFLSRTEMRDIFTIIFTALDRLQEDHPWKDD